MESKSTLLLAFELNEIIKAQYTNISPEERAMLDIKHDLIVEELKRRMPQLKYDVNLQPKIKRREYERDSVSSNK